MALKGWKKINTWRFKGRLLIIAFLLVFFDRALHWSGAPVIAGVALLLPVIGFRDFWNSWKLWATVLAFAVLQVSMVLLMRPLLEKSGFPLTYAFGIHDCAFVAAAISADNRQKPKVGQSR
jgi:hypothetical protein